MNVANDTDLIHGLLRATESTRDALPYTDEFDDLYRQYCSGTDDELSKHEFWRKLSAAAKQGGGKGKKRGQSPPVLTHQQLDKLRPLITGKLGSRDSLPYTEDFERIYLEFDTISKSKLTRHELWRTIGNLGKRPANPIVQALFQQAIDSLVLGIEHFNRPSDIGRHASVLMMLDHAAEMLLKAALADRGDPLRNPKNGYAHSLEHCLKLVHEDATLRFLSADERRTIQVLNGLRDQAQHYIVDITEEFLYTVSQGIVTLFADLFPRLFAVSLCSKIPQRVLPISVKPPKAIEILMDDALSQLRHLFDTGKSETAEPKLRSLLAIDRALNFEPTQIADDDINKTVQRIKNNDDWRAIFGGISLVKLTSDGTGANIALRITKSEGLPVRVVKDGETAEAVVAIRNVSDTERYRYSSNDLAERCKLTPPKIRALIAHLRIKDDSTLFKEIRFGRNVHPRYSQEALKKIREELPQCDMEEIWRHHSLGSRRPC